MPPGVELQGRASQPAPKQEQQQQQQQQQLSSPADEGSAADEGGLAEAADGEHAAARAKPARAAASTAGALQYMQRRLAGASQSAPLPPFLPLAPGVAAGAAAVAAAGAGPSALMPTPPVHPTGVSRWSSFVADVPAQTGSAEPKAGGWLKQQSIQAALRLGAAKAAASQAGRPPLGSRQPSQPLQLQHTQQQLAGPGAPDSVAGFAACQPPQLALGAQPGGLFSQFALGSGQKTAAPVLKAGVPAGQRGWGLLSTSSGAASAMVTEQTQHAQQNSAAEAAPAKRRRLQSLFPSSGAPDAVGMPAPLAQPGLAAPVAAVPAPRVAPVAELSSQPAAGRRILNLPKLGFLTGRFAARPAVAGSQGASVAPKATPAADGTAMCAAAVPAGPPQQQALQAAAAAAPTQQPDLGAAFNLFL